ncbi:hypothetical protein KJ616_02620 [Patescibacteria group bacterium]|nr:hypothetical protein [Patescibacteria group bacterium]
MDNESQNLTGTFVTTFYQKFKYLENEAANYSNALFEFKIRYGKKPEEAEPEELAQIMQQTKAVRYMLILIDSDFNALKTEIPELEEKEKEINTLIAKLVDQKFPSRNELRKLVHLFAGLFVKGVMAENLIQAGRVYQNLLGGYNEKGVQ